MEQNVLWDKHAGFPENVDVQVLRDDRGCGARTLLVKLPPGGKIPPHSHRGVVQRYVIDGQCEIDGERFGAGSFALLPRHSNIPLTTTKNGASILLIYDPVNE
jgi:quercetin dioxygenase-like cupin family protein